MYWHFISRNEEQYTMNKNIFIMFAQKFVNIENELLQELRKDMQRVYGHSLDILRKTKGNIPVVILKIDNSLSIKEKMDGIHDICLQYLSLECLCHYEHNDWMYSAGAFQELYINLQDWLEIVTIKDVSLNFLAGIVNEHFTKLVEYVRKL